MDKNHFYVISKDETGEPINIIVYFSDMFSLIKKQVGESIRIIFFSKDLKYFLLMIICYLLLNSVCVTAIALGALNALSYFIVKQLCKTRYNKRGN